MASTYPPVGRCIYCGATRHSRQRPKLSDEHIIPEALDGKLILPEASCGKCEGRINWFEQFCMKQMLGPVRYLLNLKTKRPKNRPLTLPLELLIGGSWTKCDVPIEIAPATIIMPIFNPPECSTTSRPTRTNIYTEKFWTQTIAKSDLNALYENFQATKGRSYRVSLHGERFALLLAKIAHAYAMAERDDIDHFHPVLPDTILRKPNAPPLPYFIGGKRELEPASDQTHELGLARGETDQRIIWMVPIRLFGWLGAPTYLVVVSVAP